MKLLSACESTFQKTYVSFYRYLSFLAFLFLHIYFGFTSTFNSFFECSLVYTSFLIILDGEYSKRRRHIHLYVAPSVP